MDVFLRTAGYQGRGSENQGGREAVSRAILKDPHTCGSFTDLIVRACVCVCVYVCTTGEGGDLLAIVGYFPVDSDVPLVRGLLA